MKVTGVLVCAASVFGAIAVWLFLLITGILGLADALTTQPINGSDVGWNIVKIVLAEAAGGTVGFIGFLIGMALIGLSE